MNQNAIKLVYGNGFKAGIQFMMDKIERQYEAGKPILANDNLYWLKGAKENLRDIMDDIEAEYDEEMAADKREDGKVEND
jgi:hypothetical protein